MSEPPSDQDLSPLAPFRRPVFRMLWSTWLVANHTATTSANEKRDHVGAAERMENISG